MKFFIFSLIVLLRVIETSGQKKNEIELMMGFQYKTGDTIFSFCVFEEEADKILMSLYEVNDKKPKVKPRHNFRNQKIDGLGNKFTIQVLVGTELVKEDNTMVFHAFKNKKDMQRSPEKQPENTRNAKHFHFMNNNLLKLRLKEDVLDTSEKMKKARAYLNELLVQ